jgi:hypothetical protein
MTPKYTAADIELCLKKYFNPRQFSLCPNISLGFSPLGSREADLLVVTQSMWCYEIEIKVSKSDIKADMRKRHQHRGPVIRKAWFAVPVELAGDENIPGYRGVLACSVGLRRECYEVRSPSINKLARKLTPDEYLKLLRLMVYRVWTLKVHLAAQRSRQKGVA